MFNDRLLAPCWGHVHDLERLARASPTIDNLDSKFVALQAHLRQLYLSMPTVFNTGLIQAIKNCTEVREKNIQRDTRVLTDDKDFIVGNFYFAKDGVFQVVALDPFPKIYPALYPPCNTLYFKQWMWEQGSILDRRQQATVHIVL